MILQQPPMQTSEGPPTQQGSTTCWPALDSVYALGTGDNVGTPLPGFEGSVNPGVPCPMEVDKNDPLKNQSDQS